MKNQFIFVFAMLLLSGSFFCGCSSKNHDRSEIKNYKPDSSSGLKISLAKTEFKMYEPIMVRVDYVNKHNHTDTIYYNFNENFDNSVKFYIVSEENEIYNKKLWSPMALLNKSSQFFINSGDTLIASMNLIFKYGEKIPNQEGSYNYFGYLKPGEYKFYAYDFIGGEDISSNELSFFVTELEEQDKKARELFKNKKYDELISNYPLNPFTEHAIVYYFGNEMYPVETWDNDNKKIKKFFFKFVNTYPNSFYNLNMPFVFSYFMKIANKTDEINDAFVEIERNTAGSLLIKFIENKYIREKIIKNYIEFKKVFESTKK